MAAARYVWKPGRAGPRTLYIPGGSESACRSGTFMKWGAFMKARGGAGAGPGRCVKPLTTASRTAAAGARALGFAVCECFGVLFLFFFPPGAQLGPGSVGPRLARWRSATRSRSGLAFMGCGGSQPRVSVTSFSRPLSSPCVCSAEGPSSVSRGAGKGG